MNLMQAFLREMSDLFSNSSVGALHIDLVYENSDSDATYLII